MDRCLLVLPGMNTNLREWASEVASEIGSIFESSLVHEYLHWSDPSKSYSLESEIDRIRRIDLSRYALYVYAKSVGCLLGLEAIHRDVIKPKANVLVGFPLGFARREGFPVEERMAELKSDTLFIHNKADTVVSADELGVLIRDQMTARYEISVFPRDDHHYPDIVGMRDVIEKFLGE